MKHRRQKLKIIAWIIASAGVLLVALAVTGWLSFQRIPSWYKPMLVAGRDLDGIRNSLPNTYQALADQAIRGEPFDFSIASSTVTAWLVARDSLYPESRDWMPGWIRDPVVSFGDDRAIVGARVARGRWQAIVGLHLVAEVNDDWVTVRVEKVTAGALPVPSRWITETVRESLSAHRIRTDRVPASLVEAIRQLQTDPQSVFSRGLRIGNWFDIKNGNRHVRIQRIWTDGDQLWLRLEPF